VADEIFLKMLELKEALQLKGKKKKGTVKEGWIF
jgi:hypothetical protein